MSEAPADLPSSAADAGALDPERAKRIYASLPAEARARADALMSHGMRGRDAVAHVYASHMADVRDEGKEAAAETGDNEHGDRSGSMLPNVDLPFGDVTGVHNLQQFSPGNDPGVSTGERTGAGLLRLANTVSFGMVPGAHKLAGLAREHPIAAYEMAMLGPMAPAIANLVLPDDPDSPEEAAARAAPAATGIGQAVGDAANAVQVPGAVRSVAASGLPEALLGAGKSGLTRLRLATGAMSPRAFASALADSHGGAQAAGKVAKNALGAMLDGPAQLGGADAPALLTPSMAKGPSPLALAGEEQVPTSMTLDEMFNTGSREVAPPADASALVDAAHDVSPPSPPRVPPGSGGAASAGMNAANAPTRLRLASAPTPVEALPPDQLEEVASGFADRPSQADIFGAAHRQALEAENAQRAAEIHAQIRANQAQGAGTSAGRPSAFARARPVGAGPGGAPATPTPTSAAPEPPTSPPPGQGTRLMPEPLKDALLTAEEDAVLARDAQPHGMSEYVRGRNRLSLDRGGGGPVFDGPGNRGGVADWRNAMARDATPGETPAMSRPSDGDSVASIAARIASLPEAQRGAELLRISSERPDLFSAVVQALPRSGT